MKQYTFFERVSQTNVSDVSRLRRPKLETLVLALLSANQSSRPGGLNGLQRLVSFRELVVELLQGLLNRVQGVGNVVQLSIERRDVHVTNTEEENEHRRAWRR